jgi:hypothetical protein
MNSAANLTIDLTGLRRGDAINGGRFVGKTARSSLWVCYEPGELAFRMMCDAFDRLYAPSARRLAAVA